MEDFHCEMFDLTFRFSVEDFDKDALLKEFNVEDESEYIDEDGDLVFGVSFGERNQSPQQHAHLRIIVYKDESKKGQATLNYHQSKVKIEDTRQPYFEECAKWLGGFFKSDEMRGRIYVVYEFEKEFTTTIPLPFPLIASSKGLSGLKVSGLSLQYPENAQIETAFIQKEGEDVFLFLQKKASIKLKEFDLFRELQAISPVVNSLVKGQETPNGGS